MSGVRCAPAVAYPERMFVGHLAVALGAKRAAPRVPLAALVTAAFALDLIWPVMLLLGVESVRIDPGATAFTPLDFEHYPWSHSLLLVLGWSVLGGTLARSRLKTVQSGVVVGVLVASHWALDLIVHRPDLPAWPGGPLFGLGLWHSVPGTFLVEGLMLVAGVELYRRGAPARDAMGWWSLGSLVAFVAAIWIAGPFSPPPPSATAIAVVGLSLWLFPFWAAWIERHRA